MSREINEGNDWILVIYVVRNKNGTNHSQVASTYSYSYSRLLNTNFPCAMGITNLQHRCVEMQEIIVCHFVINGNIERKLGIGR